MFLHESDAFLQQNRICNSSVMIRADAARYFLDLRLRYQFVPEFAPYVGVRYERAFGDTADFRRARQEKAGGWHFLIGIRSWF